MTSPCWENLPEVVLGNIFSNLQLFDKLKIKYICKSWHEALSRPEIWRSFIYSDEYIWNELISNGSTLENLKKFNGIKADLLECIESYGNCFQHVYIYFNGETSYRLFRKISQSCSSIQYVGLIRNSTSQLSEDFEEHITTFFNKNCILKEVCVENVHLLSASQNKPLPVGFRHSKCLWKLTLKNSFHSCSLSPLMYLINLQELTINPHCLFHSLINHLSGLNLKRLNIVANRQTKEFFFENLSELQWKDIAFQKSLRVHCYMGVSYDWAQKESLLKSNIPMATLVYRKCMWLQYDNLCALVNNYTNTLEEFVDYSVHEGSYDTSFKNSISNRQDRNIIDTFRYCKNLKTLAVKEILSSSTILLLAFLNRNLESLLIRDDMIMYKFDIPEDKTVSTEALDFILNNWRKEPFIKAMQELLGRQWNVLNKTDYITILQSKYSSYM